MVKKLTILICFTLLVTLNSYAQKKTKVATIGDSVTEGYGLENPSEDAYPSKLGAFLGSNYEVKNFGHSGATLLKNGHNPYSKTDQLKESIKYKADIAIIHLGLNDTDPRNFPNYRDQFISDYIWLIDTLRQGNPNIQIYICKMSPIFTGHPRFSSSTHNWYSILQESINQVALARNLPIIDLHAALGNRPDLITDAPTLHPNVEGAELIAKTVYKHLTGDFGGLKLPSIFGSYMVLQRDKPLNVWGQADAGTQIIVEWDGQRIETKTGLDGHWEVLFPAPKLSSQGKTLSILNGNTRIDFEHVLVGDVWFAAGQSNMDFRLKHALNGDSLASQAGKNKNIRILQFESAAITDNVSWDSLTLQKANNLDFFTGSWQLNNQNNAANSSAVAYSFANEIANELNIPIGIITLAIGGSPQLSWLPRQELESNPAFVQSLHPWRSTDYLMAWNRERANKNLSLTDSPFQQHPYAPSYIYEAGLSRLTPISLRGIIWYQGESDAENLELYSLLFPQFVKSIRDSWNDNLPFYYVQLSSIERPSWPRFRDKQRTFLDEIPNTGMAVTSDIGNPQDVHPKEKIVVGHRLAQWALSKQYHRKNIPSGPLYKNYKKKGDNFQLEFDYAKGLQTNDNAALKGFSYQTREGKFIEADAKIVGNKVQLVLPKNSYPIAIVYGWNPVSQGNLINNAGLPASTFRIALTNK